MLKNIVKIFLIIVSFYLLMPVCKEIKRNYLIDNVINQNKIDSSYEGYLLIPKLKYKNLIKKGSNEVLDKNLISMNEFSESIESNKNIILAGHNNKQVFHNLYYLNKNDEIILSNFKNDYKYIIKEKKYIDVTDYSIFKQKDNTLTLITCSNDNQKRLIVIAEKEEF